MFMSKNLVKKIFILFSIIFVFDFLLLGIVNLRCVDCDGIGYVMMASVLWFFWSMVWFGIYCNFFCSEEEIKRKSIFLGYFVSHIRTYSGNSSLKMSNIVLCVGCCFGLLYLFIFGILEVVR